MSFDSFVLFMGDKVNASTREQASYFVKQHGITYSWSDYFRFLRSRERVAWWSALYWTTVAADSRLVLRKRCAAVILARMQWCIFLKNVK